MSRADEIRASLEVAELEDELAELKAGRKECPECGSLKRLSPKDQKALDAVKHKLRAARQAQREAEGRG